MPDVTRTDSQRSDTSLRPRVSFNRDVHVKRIVSDSGTRVSGSALSGDGAGHLVALPVRRERLGKRSKQELADEAAKVLSQVDKLGCTSNHTGVFPEKYYSLPNRRKHRIVDSPQSSIDRKTQRRRSEELGITTQSSLTAPRKPPRTFISNVATKDSTTPKKSSAVRRSVSDATNLKSKAFRPSNDAKDDNFGHAKGKKAQLSPIIELSQREDYFAQQDKENRNTLSSENVDRTENKKRENNSESVTEKLKEYIDEIDSVLYEQGFGTATSTPKQNSVKPKPPEVVVIDVDKAEKISGKNSNKKKFNSTAIGKKLKSITTKKDKVTKKADTTTSTPSRPNRVKGPAPKAPPLKAPAPKAPPPKAPVPKSNVSKKTREATNVSSSSTIVKGTIQTLENQPDRSPKMIHSSQKPPEKLPLTRGRAVDTMVKRLSTDSFSPPPKTSIVITPNVSVQHNNNQPFSYTRGLSPERLGMYPSPDGSRSPARYEPGSPVIYAQVVCGNGGPDGTGPTKQTVLTAYTNGKKHLPHSDSDEGLGCEENSGFGRTKYDADKILTHFGDEMYTEKRNGYHAEEEFPITPKFKTIEPFTNGFGYNNEYSKTEHSIFIDSSSRGRGDGMDSRRRESLTEPHENGFVSPTRHNGTANGRSDLSARRDLLESRINSRIIGGATPVNNKFVSETTSRYYKQGSASPIGFTEKYTSETKIDHRNGERYATERNERSRTNFGGETSNTRLFDTRYKTYDTRYDNEPKSFDSQLSDYRSSPENGNVRRFETSHDYKTTNKYKSKIDKQQISKDRDLYKSNPEIHNHHQDGYQRYQETYHDSLRRQKHEDSPKRYFDQNENERKDKFGDSGIENDFRRDSGERRQRIRNQRNEFCNESEDEGFASSLLIASERQHTEDSFNNLRKQRRGYDSDRGYIVGGRDERDDVYRHAETMEYRHSGRGNDVYAHRERSIDDGSHYDPRIDKDLDKDRSSTMKLKSSDKKPPKPEKKSSLEKVKQLFTRDSSKKKREKEAARSMVREESLRARYSEYRGSRETLEPRANRRDAAELQSGYDYTNRRRLSTPSPSPTRRHDGQRNGKSEVTHGSNSWFKSLDRLSRKKNKKVDKGSSLSNAEEEMPKPPPTKNLRFFGDTDVESNGSVRRKSALKTRPRSQSTRDLHNISEESMQKSSNRSMQNINEPLVTKSSLKPPMSPHRRSAERDPVPPRRDDSKGRTRRRNEVSSVESSTEGDSSQQSQRSVVYLHAATVGDIPGPGYLRNGRRAASREELTSNSSSRIQPQVKTLSRSFSVLAPWKPRHYRESMDIDYTQYPKPNVRNGKYEQKPVKNGIRRKEDASTLKKKAAETRKSNQNISTLNRNSKSKENLSSQTLNRNRTKDDLVKGSSSTLYKKRERFSKENSRYSSRGEDKKMATKSMSVESLGGGSRTSSRKSRDQPREISRSISMPRDPEKSAGWFGLNKKSTKLKSRSTQRL